MTLRHGSNVASWKTKAKSRPSRALRGVLSCTDTEPSLMCTRSATVRSNVDLPQPEGPSMVTSEPAGISTETSDRAVKLESSAPKRM